MNNFEKISLNFFVFSHFFLFLAAHGSPTSNKDCLAELGSFGQQICNKLDFKAGYTSIMDLRRCFEAELSKIEGFQVKLTSIFK